MPSRAILPLAILLALQPGCDDLTVPPLNVNCPDSIPSWPFGDPIWHPGGQVIGFNYWPAQEIISFGAPCYGAKVNLEPSDSAGFWLIDADGTNSRRIFPEMLKMPSWSRDGDWIAFVQESHIYKIRFTGQSFDTSSVIQLTAEGGHSFPAWSPNGDWIAWHHNMGAADSLSGIWIMQSDGSQKQSLGSGYMPTWHPDGNHLLGVVAPMPDNTSRFVRYYPFTVAAPETLVMVIDNPEPVVLKYSADGARIAYWPGQIGKFELWVTGSDGSNPRSVAEADVIEYLFTPFDWHPSSSKIVFSSVQLEMTDSPNASLWTIDPNTGAEHLLRRFGPNQ